MLKPLPYLLQLLLLTPALGFVVPEPVLADEAEDGRIVSLQYWSRFRVFMDKLDTANFNERAGMLTSPDISESLVPSELLSAVSDHLKDDSWLDRLEAEYIADGEHNMTLLLDTLQELGSFAEQHQETVPQEVLRQLLWRGLVRPGRQSAVRARLGGALRLFFDTPRAVRLQRHEPELFEEYLLAVFEFDWMSVEEVLRDTLSDHHLRARLGAQSGFQEARGPRQEPHEGGDWSPEGWDEFLDEEAEMMDGEVQEGSWTGGGFVWLESEEGEHDDGDMVSSPGSEGRAGKHVREAHHGSGEEHGDTGDGMHGESESEGVGEPLPVHGGPVSAEEAMAGAESAEEHGDADDGMQGESESEGFGEFLTAHDKAMGAEETKAEIDDVPGGWSEESPDADSDNFIEDESDVRWQRESQSVDDVDESERLVEVSAEGEQSEEEEDVDDDDDAEEFMEVDDPVEDKEGYTEENAVNEDESIDEVEDFREDMDEAGMEGAKKPRRHVSKYEHKHHDHHKQGHHSEHSEHDAQPAEYPGNDERHGDKRDHGRSAAHHADDSEREEGSGHAEEAVEAVEDAAEDECDHALAVSADEDDEPAQVEDDTGSPATADAGPDV